MDEMIEEFLDKPENLWIKEMRIKIELMKKVALNFVLQHYQGILVLDEYYKLPMEIIKDINQCVVRRGVQVGGNMMSAPGLTPGIYQERGSLHPRPAVHGRHRGIDR